MRVRAQKTLLYACFYTALFCLSASAQRPELVVQTGHSGKLRTMAFSPDGCTPASGGEDYSSKDYTIKLWDTANGRELRALAGHAGIVLSVAFSPDGRMLASEALIRRLSCGMWAADANCGCLPDTISRFSPSPSAPTGAPWRWPNYATSASRPAKR